MQMNYWSVILGSSQNSYALIHHVYLSLKYNDIHTSSTLIRRVPNVRIRKTALGILKEQTTL